MNPLPLRRVSGFVAGALAALAAMFVFQAVTADAVGTGESTFVAITPCRLFDTRTDSQIGPRGTAVGEQEAYPLQVTGEQGECSIPAGATAVAINLTGVGPTAPTFVAVFPNGAENPETSVLNMVPGQSPTPNKVDVSISSDGKLAVFNRFGAIDLIGDVLGYYRTDGLAEFDRRLAALEAGTGNDPTVLARISALESKVSDLTAENAALTAKTAAISVRDAGSTVRFTGVDVQIVDGSGDTVCGDPEGSFEACNGSGNLILGYNEDSGSPAPRSGSHNIVAGPDNAYTSHSGIVSGLRNVIGGQYATVTGGVENSARGLGASVSGGSGNRADGLGASVSGGSGNRADNTYSAVAGGIDNTASGESSSVTGGVNNDAAGTYSSVTGGSGNAAGGRGSAVTGGSTNDAEGNLSTISAGFRNSADAAYTSVSGGFDNVASGEYASVSGGSLNTSSATASSVLGGEENVASGADSTISGGDSNLASGPQSSVHGGFDNTASGTRASVSGGSGRSATGTDDWAAGGLSQPS